MLTMSERLKLVEASETLTINNLIARLKKEGHDVISFSVGEPDFPTPAHVVEAAKKALDQGMTKYAPTKGIPELREAIAKKSKRENGVQCGAENVLVTPTKQALFMSCLAILDRGDEVIIPEPCWVSYRPCVQIAQGKPVMAASPGEGFAVEVEAIQEKLTPRTKMIILNSPCNPTGAVIDKTALKGIADIATDKDLWVLSDEIYEKILFEGEHVSIASIGSMRERTVTLNGFSKSYSMTGWRLGWLLGPKNLVNEVDKVQQHSLSCVPPFVQMGGIAALGCDQECVRKMTNEFRERRDLVVRRLNQTEGFECMSPRGTFYAFPRYDLKMDSKKLAELLLEKAKVAVMPGSVFGASGEGHLRFSFAASMDRINTGMDRIEEAVKKL